MTATEHRDDNGLLATLAPWLTDFGNWIFGALIAFDLVVLGAVLTVGPEDEAVKLSTAAVAMAVPPGAVGLLLLRLVTDVRKIRQSRATDAQPAAQGPHMVVLRYTVGLMLVTFLLTMVGLTAALWHIAWWSAVAFVVIVAASLLIFFLAARDLGAFSARRRPPTEGSGPKPS